ncbi:DUF1697 domain-containing protein [Microbacterium sp.]|uniref:DUF1697 domain-containing protein n=1 Tax=Microbacterium sp. TaxID=51671 RepID=UPI003A8DAF96
MTTSGETMRWVALLRGVNVNGITIRSADLRALFEGLDATAVRTVLASGNVLFTAAGTRAGWKARIEQALRDRFGYDAWIILVTADELAAVAASFPFDDADPAGHPYVVFCADAAVHKDVWAATRDACGPDERVAAGDGVVYWHAVVGTSTDSPVAKALARTRFKSGTTTRNLRTVHKMLV